jgi:hypothetical protein
MSSPKPVIKDFPLCVKVYQPLKSHVMRVVVDRAVSRLRGTLHRSACDARASLNVRPRRTGTSSSSRGHTLARAPGGVLAAFGVTPGAPASPGARPVAPELVDYFRTQLAGPTCSSARTT